VRTCSDSCSKVAWTFAQRGIDVYAFTHAQLDITDADRTREFIGNVKPALVVHCAAMTNVDACELEPDKAFAINAEGSGNVAAAAIEVPAPIVAVSTDYVFDGKKGNYTEFEPTNPIQVYGRSKLEGEQRVRDANPWHFIVRSAWIYGKGGKNFLSKLPELAEGSESITAVVDQTGSPTFAPDLAEAIADLADTENYGTYHIVNEGTCTFAEFCEAAVEILGADLRVDHISVNDLGRPAARPLNTSLVGEVWAKAGFEALRPWRDAAKAFLAPEPTT